MKRILVLVLLLMAFVPSAVEAQRRPIHLTGFAIPRFGFTVVRIAPTCCYFWQGVYYNFFWEEQMQLERMNLEMLVQQRVNQALNPPQGYLPPPIFPKPEVQAPTTLPQQYWPTPNQPVQDSVSQEQIKAQAREAVRRQLEAQQKVAGRLAEEEACKDSGNVPIKNDIEVVVRAKNSNIEIPPKGFLCVVHKLGETYEFTRVNYGGTYGHIDGKVTMTEIPVCPEQDDRGILHLRNICTGR